MTSLTEELDDDIKRRQEDDPLLQDFKDAGTTDPEYQDIIRHLKNKTAMKELKKLPQTSAVHKYLNMWSKMALLNHSDETLITVDKFR